MKVIGIDTTTKVFGMALVQDGTVLERLSIEGNGYHTEDCIVHLEEVLRKQALHKEHIDGYALSIGPGSLTGVRVGLSFLKGLGYATGKPVVGIETLYAIAHEAREGDACICPLLLTRGSHLFWALYLFSPQHKTLVDASCTPIDGLLDALPRRETLFVGSGARVFEPLIEEHAGKRARFGDTGVEHPDPAVIAMLGLERIREGNIPEIDTLEPIYLQHDRGTKIK
jgi:tRNA threonylcarbamoyladenosine biosynthesis protein TsaB